MGDWVVVLLLVIFWTALGLIAAIVGREVWWHVRAAVEGIREWRAERKEMMPYSAPSGHHMNLPGPGWDSSPLGDDGLVNQPGSTPGRATGTWAGEPDDDDEWAEELHRINLAVNHKHHVWSAFQEQLVPVSEVTHYEVEAVIRQLGRADWLPAAA